MPPKQYCKLPLTVPKLIIFIRVFRRAYLRKGLYAEAVGVGEGGWSCVLLELTGRAHKWRGRSLKWQFTVEFRSASPTQVTKGVTILIGNNKSKEVLWKDLTGWK